MSEMSFTVFCQENGRRDTLWIGTIKAETLEEATNLGRRRCAKEWRFIEDHIHVLGVASGELEFLDWNEQADD